MKRLVIVSVIFLFSAIQCSDQVALNSSHSIEPDYDLIRTLEQMGGEEYNRIKKQKTLTVEFPMITYYPNLPYGSEIIVFSDNHENKICVEKIKQLIENNKIDSAFLEFELAMSSCALRGKLFTFEEALQRSIDQGSSCAMDFAFPMLIKQKVKIKPIEFDSSKAAFVGYEQNGLSLKTIYAIYLYEMAASMGYTVDQIRDVFLFNYENQSELDSIIKADNYERLNEIIKEHIKKLDYKMTYIRDCKMAQTIFDYVRNLKKKETILIVYGGTHEETQKPFYEKYIGAGFGPMNYETFQMLKDVKDGKKVSKHVYLDPIFLDPVTYVDSLQFEQD